MTTNPDNIACGFILGVVTFLTILALPYGSPTALWLAMAGLCGLVMVQTVLAARAAHQMGVLSLAVVAVISMSAVAQMAAPAAGVDMAAYPWSFAIFLAVMVGFPLGALLGSDTPMPTGQAVVAGMVGVIYMPLPMWLAVRTGLIDYMIDVFDPRLRFGHLLGLGSDFFGMIGDILGMSLASCITLLILSLPALPVVVALRSLYGRS